MENLNAVGNILPMPNSRSVRNALLGAAAVFMILTSGCSGNATPVPQGCTGMADFTSGGQVLFNAPTRCGDSVIPKTAVSVLQIPGVGTYGQVGLRSVKSSSGEIIGCEVVEISVVNAPDSETVAALARKEAYSIEVCEGLVKDSEENLLNKEKDPSGNMSLGTILMIDAGALLKEYERDPKTVLKLMSQPPPSVIFLMDSALKKKPYMSGCEHVLYADYMAEHGIVVKGKVPQIIRDRLCKK
jgi:hypothetical protein